MSKRPLLSARSILLFRHSAFAVVGPSFYLGPLSKGLGGLEISGSIALPDRIHRFIPLVANDSRHYFALKDDTETESLRGTGPFASSLVSQRSMECLLILDDGTRFSDSAP